MGFLEQIFGKKQPEKADLGVKEIAGFLEEKQEQKSKQSQRDVLAKITELRHEITELNRHIEKLEKKNPKQDEGNRRLRKIVQTTKTSLTRQMKTLALQMNPPQTDSMEEIFEFTVESEEWLNKEMKTFGKNIAYSSTVLKDEVKGVGISVKNMVKILADIRKLIEESGVIQMKEIREQIDLLSQLSDEKGDINSKIENNKTQIENIEGKLKSEQEKLEQLKNSPEAEKLRDLSEEMEKIEISKKEVADKFRNTIAEVDKPLKRFFSYATAGHYPMNMEEKSVLELYLENPLAASKKDVKGEQLKKLLVQVRTLLEDGKLLVKDKQREKAFSSIEKLQKYNFYDNIFWELNNLEVKENEIRKTLSESSLHGKMKDKEQEISEFKNMIDENLKLLTKKEKEAENTEQEIDENKNKLAEFASKISGIKITIKN